MSDWQEIAERTTAISNWIENLKAERVEILRQDPKYAAYLDAADERGVAPMSITAFHRYNDELAALCASAPDCGCQDCADKFEAWWRENWGRVRELERILLA